MALVWIALLIESAVAFTLAAALATWAQRNWTDRARPQPSDRRTRTRNLADLAPNHRPCPDQ
ncbi:hypothetical protein GCM10027271_55170 [Saccharopolyspora gloriosae]|uniref:Uncharacterized protein n=1 Tax=Saccharopolyspora gloriosae TaxID=455344 RepID=A0A840NBB8_9PSEU|nr:hypothetical protein [Saccharopolyspora gloriosae]MBB5068894.1 hypothetical protein [Saccharopolyspora gloriosae]